MIMENGTGEVGYYIKSNSKVYLELILASFSTFNEIFVLRIYFSDDDMRYPPEIMVEENFTNERYLPDELCHEIAKKDKSKKKETLSYDVLYMEQYQTAMEKFLRFTLQSFFSGYSILAHNSARLVIYTVKSQIIAALK